MSFGKDLLRSEKLKNAGLINVYIQNTSLCFMVAKSLYTLRIETHRLSLLAQICTFTSRINGRKHIIKQTLLDLMATELGGEGGIKTFLK